MPADTRLSNPQFGTRNYGAAGIPAGAANPNLGARNQTGLAAAFPTSPTLSGHFTLEGGSAAEPSADMVLDSYPGLAGPDDVNTDFREYRRNFQPDGTVNTLPEYQNPRDKTLGEADLAALKLGTPYSPTTASPGAGNGLDPNALRGGDAVKGLVPAAAQPATLNPVEAVYQNRGQDPATQTGTVRKFQLGVGSSYGLNRTNPTR